MADKLYEVFGEFTQHGKKQEYNNLFTASSPAKAKKAAEDDYKDYLAKGYEPDGGYGPKLKVTKVEETTIEKVQENLKKRK